MHNQSIITDLLKSTGREGMNRLISWMIDEGFFTSPASPHPKFHGCYEGGLADHSYNVFTMLEMKHRMLDFNVPRNFGQKPLKIEPENIIIACLLHDVCKVHAYVRTKADDGWTRNRDKETGHALLSIARIVKFIKLEPIEDLMIRFHMGPYGCNEFDGEDKGEYPLRGDHSGDKPKMNKAEKDASKKARYGKSLANAWYHNPICKVMYFCDELETLQEKAK